MMNTFFNESWQGLATQRGLEKATDKVVGTTEKGFCKLVTDVQRGTDKIASAVKENTDKVTDAIKRVATTNAGQIVSPAVSAVHESLKSIASTTSQIADFARTHPTEIPAALEYAKTISQQFTDLTDQAKRYADENRRLYETASATQQAMQWIGGQYNSGVNGNTQNVHVGNGAFNSLWNQYGG